MRPAPNRLAIDLSTNLLRVLEGKLGGLMRCGASELPPVAVSGGKVIDAALVGRTLKQLLARNEILETRALVGVSDAVGTFRVLELPATASGRDVDAAVAKELPADPERLATLWTDVSNANGRRTVYAVAWDRTLVRNVTDAVKAAGLEPAVVELKSAALARTSPEPSCVVVDLSYEPAEIVLIDGYVPQLWHAFNLHPQPLGDLAPLLATPIRSVLRFYKRDRRAGFDPTSPILISSEQELPAPMLAHLGDLVDHPVRAFAASSRVPVNVRHSTYLTCLGLVMRREA